MIEVYAKLARLNYQKMISEPNVKNAEKHIENGKFITDILVHYSNENARSNLES
jgi:hypothetical protein